MPQTKQLVTALKRALKLHGKTYADVAEQLQLSEASVKRLFSEQSFSLQRLDEVCAMLGMEISDLVQLMQQERHAMSGLSEKQEQEIAGDLELLLVTVCVLNRWSLAEIIGQFHISENRCINHLAHLDRLKLIELLPRNRIKLLVAPNFKWRENGPIQQFFQQKLQAEFFRSRFDRESERLIVINGMLSESANRLFQRKLEQLAREFDQLNDDDSHLPLSEKKGATAVLALRPWDYGLFKPLRK
ncbi:helix-turn-helix domain-containing protein [Solemya velesiana gill symbiont]|uniref:Transcriptional regulator n=1 Tax=Solemya velesiana gill symbiont TaxID=1918948 RepID=A0A1T2KWE9_9GAMM|nr:helix-turn-helix transcriptional regulator [Solemya velesiana gill symbiont]OOZ37179.1 transcriptional regulator [Solemya velesiana gill symbiont]